MDSDVVNEALLYLGECAITELVVDLLKSRVSIRMLNERELTVEHVVGFEELGSVFYAAGQGVGRFRLTLPTDEGGWNMAAHYPSGAATVAPSAISDPWTELYRGVPNFGITLGGNGALLIEARRVIIDGKVYEVGFADPAWTGIR